MLVSFNSKVFRNVGIVFGALIVTAIVYALVTGDLSLLKY